MSLFRRPDSESGRPGSEPGQPDFSPVQVAYATNQAEAEMIQGILREEGIPSMVRRNRGFDVPDMLAAGPRDIVVPPSAAEKARQILENLAPDPSRPEGKGLIPGEAPYFPE